MIFTLTNTTYDFPGTAGNDLYFAYDVDDDPNCVGTGDPGNDFVLTTNLTGCGTDMMVNNSNI